MERKDTITETTTTTTTTFLETVCDDCGKVVAGRREHRQVQDVQNEIRVLCWVLALPSDHPDNCFFREGQCKKCVFCSDEFHFLHYTSEATGYCVKCYLDRFCKIVDDENVFRVVLLRTGRILIEIINS